MNPVDCTWNAWSAWDNCTVTCGGGTQERNRTKNPALHGGANCTGSDAENQTCNANPCPYGEKGSVVMSIGPNSVAFYSVDPSSSPLPWCLSYDKSHQNQLSSSDFSPIQNRLGASVVQKPGIIKNHLVPSPKSKMVFQL